MGKPLVNTKQWTINDKRMLIISLFVIVYPVLTGSLFMALFFFIFESMARIPFVGSNGISVAHIFWLISSGVWVLLLSIILPRMKDNHEYQPCESHIDKYDNKPTESQKEPEYKAKENGSMEKIPQAHIRIEAAKMDRINRDSILTNKSSHISDDTSYNSSMEKGTLEEKADKENFEKSQGSVNSSKENIQKSLESINENEFTLKKRKTMMDSGEFLNDCIGELEDDNKKQDDDDDSLEDDKKQVQVDVHIQNDAINDKEKYSTEKDSIEKDSTEKDSIEKDSSHSTEKDPTEKDSTKEDSTEKESTEKESAEKENKDDDSDIEMINETQDINGKIDEKQSDKSSSDSDDDKSNTDDNESQINSSELVSPVSKNNEDKQQSRESIIDDEDGELGELAEVPSLAQRRNITHTNVDTSLANASCTESPISTPTASSLRRRESNVVHLFVQ